MKNLFRMVCLVALLAVCLTETNKANATDPPPDYGGLCCQTVVDVPCSHPIGMIFDHAVWLAGHTICDD
jgi:hypothetical protein